MQFEYVPPAKPNKENRNGRAIFGAQIYSAKTAAVSAHVQNAKTADVGKRGAVSRKGNGLTRG